MYVIIYYIYVLILMYDGFFKKNIGAVFGA